MPSRIETDEQLDREVLYILNQHIGKGNAIKRWEMVARIYGPVAVHLQNDGNLQDRDIRYAVNRLRLAGHFVCDLGDGRGRYLAANAAEFREFYSFYKAPLQARSAVLKAMSKAAAETWADAFQLSLFEMAELEVV